MKTLLTIIFLMIVAVNVNAGDEVNNGKYIKDGATSDNATEVVSIRDKIICYEGKRFDFKDKVECIWNDSFSGLQKTNVFYIGKNKIKDHFYVEKKSGKVRYAERVKYLNGEIARRTVYSYGMKTTTIYNLGAVGWRYSSKNDVTSNTSGYECSFKKKEDERREICPLPEVPKLPTKQGSKVKQK